MPAGGKIGNKGGGRKTAEEEFKACQEKMKKIALEELAKTKVYGHLENIKITNRQSIKEIALPIYLKSKAEKVEYSGQVQIGGFNYIKPKKDEDNNSDNLPSTKARSSMGETT